MAKPEEPFTPPPSYDPRVGQPLDPGRMPLVPPAPMPVEQK